MDKETLDIENRHSLHFMRYCLLVFVFILLSVNGFAQCSLSVGISAPNTSICSGNKVTLTATTSGGTAPFTYTWSTGENTKSIAVNKEGTYTVTISDKTPGCQPVSKSINIVTAAMPDAPTASPQLVCPNTPATLRATAPGGLYQWFDSGGVFLQSGDTYLTPPINSGTTFYVQTTVNGCTSLRTAVFVNSTGDPTVTGASVCSGSSARLTASGGDNYQWYASSTSSNSIGTGPTFDTPPLSATTVYYVVATINGCTSSRTPVTAKVTPAPIPPVAGSTAICSGSKATLHANPGAGVFSWYDVPSGGDPLILSPDYTTPVLTATKTYYVQNTVNSCESARTPVTVTVTPIPQAPGSQSLNVCNGGSILLTASSAPGTYKWYDKPVSGRLLKTGNTYQTPALNSTTNYYVQLVDGDCASPLSVVKVVVSPPPAVPSVSGAIICYGSSAMLLATGPGGTYDWFSTATSTSSLHTGASFLTPSLSATTRYYVQTTTASGCVSARSAVTVTVRPAVNPPSAASTSTCSGSTVIVKATGSAGSYEWYDSATGGNLLASSQAYETPPVTSNTTYYVQSVVGGCISARTPVTVSINPVPAVPIVSGATTICAGSKADLIASAPAGTPQWYDAPAAGNLLKTGAAYTTPVLQATTTYYVQNTIGQCISARTPVTVTVNTPAKPQFKYPSGSICRLSSTNPIPVINNPAGGTFSVSTPGLVFISTTTGEIDLGSSTAGTYTITFTGNGSCATPTSIKYKIFDVANSSFSLSADYCQDENNPGPILGTGASAGIFSATPAGLVFVNSSTGEIDLKKSTPGKYTVSNDITAIGGCSADHQTAVITIHEAVIISAGPNQTLGKGSVAQLNGSVSSNANAHWSGGTGTFSNINIPNPTYTPGPSEVSATLTFTSNDPPGLCGQKADNVNITFNNTPAAPTVTGNETCLGSGANLSAIAPGGTYNWYNVATGGVPFHTGATYSTPALLTNTTYYIEAVNNAGFTGPRTAVVVTVNAIPDAPVVPVEPVCAGSTITLTPTDLTGSFEWYDAATGGNPIAEGDTYQTPRLNADRTYYVERTVNGCTSPRTKVDITVSPLAAVTSRLADDLCSGNTLNYTITANMPTATFLWSRAQIAGISNPPISQSTGTITETLINTSAVAVDVKYVIIPVYNNCQGNPFTYTVTVYPTPAVMSANDPPPMCNQTPVNYRIKFNTTASFDWSRNAVPGIKNIAVSGQTTPIIRETLFNTTNDPIEVTYVIASKTSTCEGAPFSVKVTVNPSVHITSDNKGITCSGEPQNYSITSNLMSTTYLWSRQAVTNISNPTVTNQTSSTITETLINTGPIATHVVYIITPIANGCEGPTFFYVVIVKPQPSKPVANSNSPICVGSTIKLRTPDQADATFAWTGPNGFSSTEQNPNITGVTTANLGDYNLTVTVNGCPSPISSVKVEVRKPPVANAGRDQLVCINSPSIILNGNVSGGTSTGIWTTAGSGTFSPSITDMHAQYTPTAADKAAGKVVFTLTSTSDDDCAISTDMVTVSFGPEPAVIAGPDQDVCSQISGVQLDGKVLIASSGLWSSSGTGNFIPSAASLNAVYVPTAADVAAGSVNLTLLATNAGLCDIPTDALKVNFIPPPTVNAGGKRYVLRNRTITLNPSVSDNNVQYLWTPNLGISNNTVKNPVITGMVDRVYTLQITDVRGCIAKDTAVIKVSPEIVIPNTFTPNGDGVNDLWNIQGLIAYNDATIDIFTRYGQKVYHSIGYDKPWDGVFNGEPLPVGVYYYVINTKLYNQVLSGSITIIK
jgi:gliding motility-associated-like protein